MECLFQSPQALRVYAEGEVEILQGPEVVDDTKETESSRHNTADVLMD